MKIQKYIVTIEMPDGDMISSGWLQDIIQGDCDVEDEGRSKVFVEEISTSEDLEKEIDRIFFQKDCGSDRLHHKEIADIARHFYELGKARR